MVEVQDDDGQWRPVVAPVWPNAKYGEEQGQKPFAVCPVPPRHYGLFSVLADVRNRTGRGKVTMIKHEIEGVPFEFRYDTDDGGHDPIEPIATPRGVPLDANPAWRAFATDDNVHDATWLTLQEIEAAPQWDQVLYEQAVAIEEDYIVYQETGKPPGNHARSVGGPGLAVVTEVEYAAGKRGENQTAVDFRWTGKTVREDVATVWWAIVAMMTLVAPEGDSEKVRLLAVFDS
jgi:hypothetical protein